MMRTSWVATALVAVALGGCGEEAEGPGGLDTAMPEADVTIVEPDTSVVEPTQPDTTGVAPTDPDTSIVEPTTPDATVTEPDVTITDPALPWQPPVVVPVNVGSDESAAFEHPPLPEPLDTRRRLRVDVEMLDKNFQRTLGGTTWTVGGVNQFEAYAATLGSPNFIDTTFEDLEPTVLFQKFLADAARSACADRLDADVALFDGSGAPVTGPTKPVLLGDVGLYDTLETAPELVEARLSRLVLLFHGRRVAPGSEGLAPWRWLFESSTLLADSPRIAWLAVCVALVSHPDFYTY